MTLDKLECFEGDTESLAGLDTVKDGGEPVVGEMPPWITRTAEGDASEVG